MKYFYSIIILLIFKNGFCFDYQRSFSDTTVHTGDTIRVQVHLMNKESDTLKGVVYSEYIPINISVVNFGVKINDNIYQECLFESGSINETYLDHIPYRWIFQSPPDFAEGGYLLPADSATIEYGLTINTDTTFSFNQDSWYGGLVAGNSLYPVFGYDSLNNVQLAFSNQNTDIQNSRQIPINFILMQNYPNPFNPSTTIKFRLPRDIYTTISIYSITGAKVKNLMSGFMREGFHSVGWDGKNQNGFPVSSGVYIYELVAGEKREVKKMLLAK
jgi:hypothetical protein